MTFHQPDSIRYFTFDLLSDAGLSHALFTRIGGVSPRPWMSLNLGGTVGDDPGRVAENRHRAMGVLGKGEDTIYDVWQVHGKAVVCATAPRPAHVSHLQADAILTDRRGLTLLMRFADCVPILLFDPVKHVVGIAHAGWQGTVKRTAAAAVTRMMNAYDCRPENLMAGIGPAICPHHYAVGDEVVDQVRLAFGESATALLLTEANEVKFDLWKANRLILEEAGVRKIEESGICTACNLADWYSHRGEGGKTGRFGVAVTLG